MVSLILWVRSRFYLPTINLYCECIFSGAAIAAIMMMSACRVM